MPCPKRKTSKQRRNKKNASRGLEPHQVSACQTCQAPIASHVVCKECGYYKGIKVLATKMDRLHKRGEARRSQPQAEPAQTE